MPKSLLRRYTSSLAVLPFTTAKGAVLIITAGLPNQRLHCAGHGEIPEATIPFRLSRLLKSNKIIIDHFKEIKIIFSLFFMCMISFYKLFGISFMSNSIRHRLKEALIARGMSPAELAKTIGVGNGYISQLLSGYISQPKKNLTAICQALRVREQWMLTGRGPADADDENDGLIKVPLVNGVTNSTNTNKKYIECYGISDHADLEAYFLSASEFLDEDTYVIIN
ncbi:helix-turn-helix transcriptional regulator, partial [Serratia ureilytica]|uniref:helix-turn-helix domain-containing protein n=1 Tax=Serratia ureilytica TaxID=300181 RepID=UPI001AA19DCF